jgi:hypothetical protein
MKTRKTLSSALLLASGILTVLLAEGALHAQQPGKIPPTTKSPSLPVPPKVPSPQMPATPTDYLYTAETNETTKKQGLVKAGSLSWGCQGGRCVAKSAAPTPDVPGCRALAEQVGQIKSYGHPARLLNGEELRLCNAGIAASSMPGIAPTSPGAIPPVARTPLVPPIASPEKSKLDPALSRSTPDFSPRVTGYSAPRVVAGDTLAVFGSGFGSSMTPAAMRLGGEGLNRILAIASWSANRVEVRMPADVRPGRYYIGVADGSGRWLSNIDQRLDVIDPLRRLPVQLEVKLGCSLDVVTSSPSVGMQFAPAVGEGSHPVAITLRAAGSRSGPEGSMIYQYQGTAEILVGRYRMAATDSNFNVDVWDYINGNSVPVEGGGRYIKRINWEDCYIHRRVNDAGHRLPRPERESHSARLDRESLTVTAETSEIRLEGYTGMGGGLGGAALQTPTPIEIP